jgi:hypothetical protein
MDQYLQFDSSITAVEMNRGGLTMIAQYGNLTKTRAAKQRARITHLINQSALTNCIVQMWGIDCCGTPGGYSFLHRIIPTRHHC